ncbi:MAG: UDP-N-acetylmuramoyl-L-alanine--D-glutamate ligase [bacterium]|nr:UDP-N-acetylmuramoyl-L-alanine--D-glutamate ligase [bacterium]
MKQTDFKDKRITVMGLGFHKGGEGVARYLAEKGAIVTVTDINPEEKMYGAVEALRGLPIRFILGRHEESDFIDTDMVVRNPGVPHTSPYLRTAKDAGIPIEMESSLFFKLSPTRNIVAITGTKGKSTTAHLAAYVCEQAGKQVHLMGNLVKSMLAELDTISPDSIVVLELSSYQCEGFAPFIGEFRTHGLGPSFSILTNLYPDHLNRYSSMEEYAVAKKQLMMAQSANQITLLSKESEWSTFFSKEILPDITWYDTETIPTGWKMRLLGSHNRLNAGAVLQMARKMDFDPSIIEKAVCEFSGVEHRLEFVKSLEGVDFYNDTTATNPTAAKEGIKTIQDLNRKIVLLAGGNDKNMDFTDFVALINIAGIRTVLLQGSADAKLKAINPKLIVGSFADYSEAIRSAYQEAKPAGVVLLSPGATSFNMFRDEFDRGRQFKEIVNSL